MNSTLFNTMLGCLAALSLAGCGNSSKGDVSSSSSAETMDLISDGFNIVEIVGGMENGGSGSYYIRLRSNSSCTIKCIQDQSGIDTWGAHWSGSHKPDGSYHITISDVCKMDSGCDIHISNPLVLRIPDDQLPSYRSGAEISGASFDSPPFTHKAADDCLLGVSAGTEEGTSVSPLRVKQSMIGVGN